MAKKLGTEPEPDTEGDADYVAPEWRAWVAENLVSGVSEGEIIERLTAEGVEVSVAQRIYRRVATAPETVGALRGTTRGRRLELVVRLLREVAEDGENRHAVPRATAIDRARFYDEYYAANRPVVLPGYASRWPAMGWTFAGLADRFGDAEVQVTTRREEDANYNLPNKAQLVTMKLREVIARIEREPRSNDFYMVAQGRNVDLPELHGIFDDIDLADGLLDPARIRGASALWLGPGGTLTPLHHDTSNILFVQVVGRKRFRMAAPTEVDLAENAHAMYALDEDGNHRLRGSFGESVLEKEVLLEPGDALFIPAGWWHHVEALEASISLAFNNFPRDNDFDWYRPGNVG